MKKSLFAISAAVALLASCSLKEDQSGTPDRTNSYNSYAQAQSVVNNAYRYTSFITTNFGLMAEACTDLWHCETTTVDGYLNISPANPGHGASIWNSCYTAIMSCNEAIECILNRSTLPDEDKYPLQAEARVLRAMYYYFLTNTFDGVPFYLYMVEDRGAQDAVQKLPRTPANDIRKALYEDLRDNAVPYFTEENGLKARPSEVTGNRAGYALALMLMAKFAMWYTDWDQALYALTLLEDLYGDLTEENYPLSDTAWSIKNTPESIFEIQHAWSTTGVQYSSSYGRMLLPAYSGDSIFDGVFMPELGNDLSGWAPIKTNRHFVWPSASTSSTSIFSRVPLKKNSVTGLLEIDTDAIAAGVSGGVKLDRRTQYVIGLGKLSTGDTFNQVARGNYCYAGPKFWCYGMVGSYDSNNYKIFRYADAVLMMAECYAMKGRYTTAMSYLNKTRVRAGLDPMSDLTNREDFLSELRDERARELAGELHRKYDLVRWGIWYTETLENNTYSTLKTNIREFHQYYPIPDTECALSGYVLTNDAYNQQ